MPKTTMRRHEARGLSIDGYLRLSGRLARIGARFADGKQPPECKEYRVRWDNEEEVLTFTNTTTLDAWITSEQPTRRPRNNWKGAGQ